MEGKPVAAVTGASSGIGEVFARQLAARGFRLLLIARRRERLEALAEELQGSYGAECELLVVDLSREDGLVVAEQRLAGLERLELLVNNAGFGSHGRFFEVGVEKQDQMHRLHILATVRLTHAALVGMVRRNRGGVINVSSVAGFVPTPGSTSYCASKGWMNMFTEGLSLELRSAGSAVKVQALCPGFTLTEFHDAMGTGRNPKLSASLWMTAEQVVQESLEGLERGKLFVVPGWRYKLLTSALKVIPAPLRRWRSIQYARGLGRLGGR
jgi:uncharacterized protein